MGNRVEIMEKAIKKLADQKISKLKSVADNINTLLRKLDQGIIHGSRDRTEDQGPNKCTRENSKKTEMVKVREIKELKASIMNMNILADQTTDILKNL